jgi:hypothetical protein
MDPKHTQESKSREGLARLLFDNAGLALVTNLVNGVMWELVIWTSLGSSVVLGRYACLGLVTLQRWRTVLANHHCEQTEVASGRLVDQYTLRANATGGGPKTATPVWRASCRSHG